MRLTSIATMAVLALMTCPALAAANPEALDRAAALFEEYAPAEPDIPLDQLIGDTDPDATPNPALIIELAPEVVQRADADNPSGDDFGDFDALGEDDPAAAGQSAVGASPGDAQIVQDMPEPSQNPVPDAPVTTTAPAEPVIPDGWTSYQKFGLGFATPPDFNVMKDDDDEFALANSDMKTPEGCAVMVGLDRTGDPSKDLPPGAELVTLPDRDLGFGIQFSVLHMKIAQEGMEVSGTFVFSKQPFRDKDNLNMVVSCVNQPNDVSEVVIPGVLGSLHLVEAPVLPVPESEKPHMGGLVTGDPPQDWTSYRSNDTEWIVIAPYMYAAVNFRIGYDALFALEDLAPEELSSLFADAPTIEHTILFGTDGWLFSGKIAPDDPERGIYNGGIEGPISYFFADRCMPSGDALVVSISAQQSWIDKGNSYDPFLKTVALHWPEGEAVCSENVAKAMAAATGKRPPETAPLPKAAEVDLVQPGSADMPPQFEAYGPIVVGAIETLAGVRSGPTRPSEFQIAEPMLLKSVMTYHWNSGQGARLGSIALIDETGRAVGDWPAAGKDGQGGVPNAYWCIYPEIVLEPGRYRIVDGDPGTWSTNAEVGGRGIFRVELQRVRQVEGVGPVEIK